MKYQTFPNTKSPLTRVISGILIMKTSQTPAFILSPYQTPRSSYLAFRNIASKYHVDRTLFCILE